MLGKLRRQSMKSLFKSALILIYASAFLLILIKGGTYFWLKGPISLDGDSYHKLEGKYVFKTIKYPLEIFEESKEKYETKKCGYVVYDEVKQEYIGVLLDYYDYLQVEETITQAWNYLSYESDQDVTASFQIQGTLHTMDAQTLSYFNRTMEYIFEDYQFVDEAYYIEADQINGVNIVAIKRISIFIFILWLIALIQLLRSLGGSYKKGFKEYLIQHPTETMNGLECDFNQAISIGKQIWLGRNHTFTVSNGKCVIIKNAELIWAYYYESSSKVKIRQIRYYTKDRKMRFFGTNAKDAAMLLALYETKFSHIVIGYDREKKRIFDHDFHTFLNQKYNASKMNRDSFSYGQKDPYEYADLYSYNQLYNLDKGYHREFDNNQDGGLF